MKFFSMGALEDMRKHQKCIGMCPDEEEEPHTGVTHEDSAVHNGLKYDYNRDRGTVTTHTYGKRWHHLQNPSQAPKGFNFGH